MIRNTTWPRTCGALNGGLAALLRASSVLSLLLCVAAAALWVRARTTVDTVVWRTGHPVADDWQRTEYMSRSLHGRLVFWSSGRLMTGQELGDDPAAAHAVLAGQPALHHWANERRAFRRTWPDPAAGLAGVIGVRWQAGVEGTSAKLGVPLWIIVAATALLPAAHGFARWRRRRRQRAQRSPRGTGFACT